MRDMVLGETRNQLTELRRGVLEHCVLAVLREGESYAFDIVRVLSGAGELVTSRGRSTRCSRDCGGMAS